VFSLPLVDHGRLHVIVRNFAGDGGVDYLLEPGGGASIPLAAFEGHFRGPGLAWAELLATAQLPDRDHTTAEPLLLLLPVCADTDPPSTALEVVSAALVSVGARSQEQDVSTELLNISGYWSPCPWTTVDDILVCLGPHTYRRPGVGSH
jgi:hypothetical protein